VAGDSTITGFVSAVAGGIVGFSVATIVGVLAIAWQENKKIETTNKNTVNLLPLLITVALSPASMLDNFNILYYGDQVLLIKIF
jgi:hypothetical protein